MKRKNRNTSFTIIDDPLNFISPEQEERVKKQFDKWIIKRIGKRLKSYKGPPIILGPMRIPEHKIDKKTEK